jgi:hypothetical protein
VAENCSTDRPSNETDEIGTEGSQRCGERIFIRKKELSKDQAGGGSVEKSYHSMAVPIVEATMALRNCASCSDADKLPYVAVVMSFFPGVSTAVACKKTLRPRRCVFI